MVDKVREFLCGSVSIFGRRVQKWVFFLLVLFLMFAIKGYKHTPDYSDVKPSYYGTFYDALNCYSFDITKAQTLYNGKIIELSGIVKRIGEENDDGAQVYYVGSKSSNNLDYILRVFVTNRNQRELEKFASGAVIAFRGECYGRYDKETGFYLIDLLDAYVVRCFTPQNPVGLPEYIENIPKDKFMSKSILKNWDRTSK